VPWRLVPRTLGVGDLQQDAIDSEGHDVERWMVKPDGAAAADRVLLSRAGRQIYDVLKGAAPSAPPMTSADVYRALRARGEGGLALSTVRRNLAILEKAGLIKRQSWQGERRTYSLAERHAAVQLVDVRSGSIVQVEGAAFEDLLRACAARHGYALARYEFTIFVRPKTRRGRGGGESP
jgi:Fe2+ or Zn2+ uptake regulation protein